MEGTSSKDKKNAASGIQDAGNQLYSRTQATPEEQAQYKGSFDIGKFLEQYFGAQAGRNAMPEGALNATDQFTQNNPLAKTLYDQTLSQAQDPDKYYQSTLQPQLMQAQDTINSYYQKRGLLNSGLAIESMGRAGVDLAIKDAQARMQSRQQALGNAQAVNQNVYTNNQQNLANLANLYSNQQTTGQGAMNRQAQGATATAQYQAYPYQAQLGNYYGGQAAMQGLPGQLIGAAGAIGAGMATGGTGFFASPAAPAAAACWVASEIFGGWYHPKTVSARRWVISDAPEWFREFYIKHGQNIAGFISDKPILKSFLKPLFELFAKWGDS